MFKLFMPHSRNLFLLLFGLLLPSLLMAETQPITIHSDSAEFDHKKGTAIHRGNVIMKQVEKALMADTLIIERDEQGKINKMIAYGQPARFHAADLDKPATDGQSQIIQYYPKQNKLIFKEDAILVQNQESIQGSELIYDLVTKILISEPTSNKRTTVTLRPKDSKTKP